MTTPLYCFYENGRANGLRQAAGTRKSWVLENRTSEKTREQMSAVSTDVAVISVVAVVTVMGRLYIGMVSVTIPVVFSINMRL